MEDMTIFSDPINLLFLAIAAVAGFRLWQMLGKRSGTPTPMPPPGFKIEPFPTDSELKVSIPPPLRNTWQGHATEGSMLAISLDGLAEKDPQYDSNQFLVWAKNAHESILNAFANGDIKVLTPLLNIYTMALFDKEIMRRKAMGESAVFKFVSIKAAAIKQVLVEGGNAQIEVAFTSTVYSAIKNAVGDLISGNDKRPAEINELWTFERSLNSEAETWHLSETHDLPEHA